MRTYAKKIMMHPLFSGSAIMILGSNLANFFAYVYHFVIGRLLSPSSYGELGALLSVLGLLAVSMQFLGLVIVKFISSAKDKELTSIYSWFMNLITKLSLVIGVVLLVVSPLISNFLHINFQTVLLISPILVFSLFNFFYRSVLQGLLRFKSIVISGNFEVIVRLLVSVMFILIGWSVFEAMMGYAIAAFVNVILLKYSLRDFRHKQTGYKFNKTKEVIKYSLPIFAASFFTYAMVSIDVIMVKHFLPANEAGTYTVLSVLGKIIFFASSPIISVMFPIISKRLSQGLPYKQIFRLSILMTFAIISILVVGFKFMPSLAVGVLYGRGNYLEAYQLLYVFGVFIGFYTLSTQIINYYLSLGVTKIVSILPVALIAQVSGFIFFHDDLVSIINVSLAVTGFLLIYLMWRLINDKKI